MNRRFGLSVPCSSWPTDGLSPARHQNRLCSLWDNLASEADGLSHPQALALPAGPYVLWHEVSKELDHNTPSRADARPSPTTIPWKEYGDAYRRQPSVVYKVPFTIGATSSTGTALDYVGYGDPDGRDGNVRAPDSTITSNIAGSGASRLAIITEGCDSFRVRVVPSPQTASVVPDSVSELEAETPGSRAATIKFRSPLEDEGHGKVKGYDIRYRVGDVPLTAETFDQNSIDPKVFIEIGRRFRRRRHGRRLPAQPR